MTAADNEASPKGIALVACLAGIGTAGFSSSIGGLGLWLAVVSGAGLAVATATFLRSRLVHATEWLLASMLAMLILGPLLALGRPTPTGFSTFFTGLGGGWADVLTSTPRVPASSAVLVPPYVLAWAATTVGLLLLSKSRLPGLPALPAIVAFGITMLFGGEFGVLSVVLGVALASGTLILGWWQQRNLASSNDIQIGNTTALVRRERMFHATGLLLGIAVLAPLIGSVLPGFDDDRYDIRDLLEPPWDPLDEPSPLAGVKQNLLAGNRDQIVFSAATTNTGEQLSGRWAIATLAHYDEGFVWTVGDTAADGDTDFIPLDRRVPSDPALGAGAAEIDENSLVEVTVEIPDASALSNDEAGAVDLGVWVPLPGRPVEVTAVDGDGNPADVRVSESTGTIAIPAGSAGHTVTALVMPFAEAGEGSFEVTAWETGAEELSNESSAFRSILGRLSQRGSEPCTASTWEAVLCVQDNLQVGGYIIEVGQPEAAPGHSIPRLEELAADREPESYAGFEEQYGALAGLATRRAGVASRVVVGYIADAPESDSIELSAENIDVWIEVLTDSGWVSVDVTPDRENEPELSEPGRSTTPITDQIPPIPPPPPAPVNNPTVEEEEDLDDEDEEVDDEPSLIVDMAIAGGISLAVPATIGAFWLGAMGLLKSRRSNRRKNATNPEHQVAGAWYDSLDRLAEAGLTPKGGLSTSEFAEIIDLRFDGETQMVELAALTDAAAFGPNTVDVRTSELAWERFEQTHAVINRDRSLLTGVKRLADPTPLFKGDPLRHRTEDSLADPTHIELGDNS